MLLRYWHISTRSWLPSRLCMQDYDGLAVVADYPFFLASFKKPGHLRSPLGGNILHMILMCLLGMWVTLTSKSNNLPSTILSEPYHWPFSKAHMWIQLGKFHADRQPPLTVLASMQVDFMNKIASEYWCCISQPFWVCYVVMTVEG